MGKPMQQSDIDFIMRKYGMLQSLQIHPNLANADGRINGQIPTKPQDPHV